MIPAILLVQVASVEPYLGSSGRGDVYGPAESVPCYYEGQRRVVRDVDGNQVTSEGVAYMDPREVPVGSRVTIGGRVATVITVSRFDDGGLTGLAHVEVALT